MSTFAPLKTQEFKDSMAILAIATLLKKTEDLSFIDFVDFSKESLKNFSQSDLDELEDITSDLIWKLENEIEARLHAGEEDVQYSEYDGNVVIDYLEKTNGLLQAEERLEKLKGLNALI